MNHYDEDLPLLVSGLDIRANGRIRTAYLDPEGAEYPYSADFHSSKTVASFERYWLRRFRNCRELHIVVGLEEVQPPSLLLWLMQGNCKVVTLDSCDLRPFRREAANYAIPPKYRRAHAIAQCAATKLRAPEWLARVSAQLSELNFQLREMEHQLTRLHAARLFS